MNQAHDVHDMPLNDPREQQISEGITQQKIISQIEMINVRTRETTSKI